MKLCERQQNENLMRQPKVLVLRVVLVIAKEKKPTEKGPESMTMEENH